MRNRHLLAAAVVAALCLPACTTMRLTEANFLYPDSEVEAAALERGQQVTHFTVDSSAGPIAATRVGKPGNRTVVLYCGGNQFRAGVQGGDIVAGLPADVDVVLFDYPGYGDSGGQASVDGIMAAALAVYDHVAATAAPGQRLAVHGLSLGGFAASHVAGARSPDLLVLEATAPDAERWGASMTPWFAKPFVEIEFAPALAAIDNVDKLRDYTGRALLLVGSRDSQTSPALMRMLHADLRGEGVDARFQVIEGRGHGNVLGDQEARRVLAEFLAPAG